jgi:hypothetical protein
MIMQIDLDHWMSCSVRLAFNVSKSLLLHYSSCAAIINLAILEGFAPPRNGAFVMLVMS